MNDVVFYVLGGCLVVLAVSVSFIGLRFERFPPSRGALAIGLAVVIAVVAATAAFAWLNAEDEQSVREEEQAAGEIPTPAEVAQAEAAGTTAVETTTGGGETTGPSGPAASAQEGAQLFDSQGCSGCHTLQASGATGTVGPNLDEALRGKPKSFIETSIVDPSAMVEKGFSDVMPKTFGQKLSEDQIGALVDYLFENAGAKQQ